MVVRKFYAANPRDALRQVREALGPDALILSNRRAPSGVEIMAVAASEVQAVTIAAGPPPSKPPLLDEVVSNGARGVARHAFPNTLKREPANVPANVPSARPGADAPFAWADKVQRAPVRSASAGSPAASAAGINQQQSFEAAGSSAAYKVSPPAAGSGGLLPGPGYDMVHELRLLRSLLEGQLAAFAYTDLKRRDATKGELLRRLLGAGFSNALAREMIDELPDGLDAASALRLTKTRLQQRMRIALPGAGLVDAGGFIALVGPTGVGKTTTVAKLAAECAIRHGADKLALVTTDTFRIGAVDQLRIYGKILGVPVYAIRTEADLKRTLADLRTRHLVLIDTVGMSQRDRRLADQVALLAGSVPRVRRVLLLSAVSNTNVLEDVVRAYKGDDLAGCILTKSEEALTLGSALDILVRHGLTLHYVANGQRVPEDLHRPNPLYLIERAFREGSQAAPLDDADVPFTLAAGQN